MLLRIFITLSILLLPSESFAKPSLYEFVVGGAIKNLAKVYLKTSNLPKLKAKYIKMIANMKEEKFRKNYMKFYTVYKQLPSNLKENYSFTEQTSKSEVIEIIDRVNKREIMTILSKIPCEFIVKQTRYYAAPPQGQLPPSNVPVNEMFLWKRIILKV